MVNKDNMDFMPEVAIPPGETIRENMEFLVMDQEELAARLGITPKHLSNILNANAPITYETALKLETAIGPGAQFWMNLETNYQLNKARHVWCLSHFVRFIFILFALYFQHKIRWDKERRAEWRLYVSPAK